MLSASRPHPFAHVPLTLRTGWRLMALKGVAEREQAKIPLG